MYFLNFYLNGIALPSFWTEDFFQNSYGHLLVINLQLILYIELFLQQFEVLFGRNEGITHRVLFGKKRTKTLKFHDSFWSIQWHWLRLLTSLGFSSNDVGNYKLIKYFRDLSNGERTALMSKEVVSNKVIYYGELTTKQLKKRELWFVWLCFFSQ